MGYEEGSLILDSPTGTYFAGQFVNGRVVFELTKVKKVRGIFLKAKGFCKVHWTSEHSRRENDRTVHYTQTHESYEEYLNMKVYLIGSDSAEVILNPGKYDYPFSFQLPNSCPSSYESSLAHVRYEVRAVADRAFKVDQEIGHPLRVVAPLDLNQEDCKDPVDFEFDQNYCCWCMNSGSSETLVKMPRSGYCPGQTIPLEVSCKNSSTVEIEHIRFTIKKDITYRAVNNPDTKHETENLLEVRKGPVPGNTDRNWTVELKLPEMDVHNMKACSYIDVGYTFKVSVEPDGCHENSDDSCDLILGTVPLAGGPPAPHVLPDQLPQTVAYPTAHQPYPIPVLHQPVSQTAYPGATSPYPPNPYPNTSPFSSPNSGITPYPNTSPYPPNPYPNTNSPYPPPYPTTPHGTAPYPNGTPNSSPYPAPSPYPNPAAPHPNPASAYPSPAAPHPNPASAYPSPAAPHPNPASAYPSPAAPYPTAPTNPSPGLTNSTLVKSENPGFGSPNPVPMPMPSLPPGAALPYPSNAPSPYATASAPVPATPDSDLKNPPLEGNANSSPYNPDFLKGN